MKKLLVLALVVLVAWGYYSKNGGALPAIFHTGKSASDINYQKNYKCDGRQHCSQMTSYEEAKFFIDNCPNTKMDGDNDGIPCERQFGR